MPRQIQFIETYYDVVVGELRTKKVKRPVATKEELLAFANSVRKAGGADQLTALFPSTQFSPSTCLIATALNFHSQIDKYDEHGWCMNVKYDIGLKIAKSVPDVQIIENDDEELYEGGTLLKLPEHIGNAAAAFDAGLAFQEYVDA